ncbi:MAG: hypothetical protein SWK76_05330 [Actinomycetota bacterium]|nr:hypothetical protein [Actinomycetota bacterium]
MAEGLAGMAGFSGRECSMIRVAGYLHDLEKLAVPKETLEKPGKLTEREFDIIRAHPYRTFRTLEPIEDLEIINRWSAFHTNGWTAAGIPFTTSPTTCPWAPASWPLPTCAPPLWRTVPTARD